MPLTYPTFDELAAQITAEFRVQLPEVDPTIFGTWALSFAKGNAALAQALTFLVRDLEKQLFPQTATGEFLDLWGGYEGLARLEAGEASGLMSATGTPTTSILALTQFTGSNGILYETTATATISASSVNIPVGGLTSSGTTATVLMDGEHYLATGMSIVIAGANQAEYNGTYVITVISTLAFTYQFAGSGTSPATTGSNITVAADFASVPVKALTSGVDTNLGSGALMTIVTPIVDIDDDALVQFEGLTGGTSIETDEAYRSRILLSRSLIEGVFTPDQIKLAVLSLQGNTRAWVKKPVSGAGGGATTPEAGQCSVYFLRDDQVDPTPSTSKVNETQQRIIDDGALPANMVAGATGADPDLYVQGPTLGPSGVPTAFDFTALSPDTSTMREAVENTLAAFFKDTVDFEEDVTEASYLGAIQNTQDLVTGDFISTFVLSTPLATISIGVGEIGALGAITWSI